MSSRSSSERAPFQPIQLRPWAVLLLVVVCLTTAPLAAQTASDPDEESVPIPRRPLAVRSQNPVFLMFLRLAPTGATVPAAGDGRISVVSDYSSFFLADESADTANIAVLDGELWRNALRATVGLGRGLALTVEIPTLYGGGGFLDHIIEEYHSIFGFDQGGRDKNPDDQFVFGLATADDLAFLLPQNDPGLADVSATLDWAPWEETRRRPAVLLRAGVELPTGDEEIGYGSGGTDFGLGLALEKGIGKYRVYAGAGYQVLDAPPDFETAGVRIRDTWSADLSAERPVGRHVALVGQIGYEKSPLRHLELPNVDSEALILAVSASWSVSSRWNLDFSFIEDLDGETSQDLTVRFAAEWRF